MGYEVISKVDINFNKKISVEVVERVKQILKDTSTSYYSFDNGDAWICFELSGNKGVDYTALKKIQKEFKPIIQDLIGVEFSECDNGYYYDSENPDMSEEE